MIHEMFITAHNLIISRTQENRSEYNSYDNE